MVSACQFVRLGTSGIKESVSNAIRLVRVVKELPTAARHALTASCFHKSSLPALRNARPEHITQTTLKRAQVAIKNVQLAPKMLVSALRAQGIQATKQTFT